MRVLIVAASLPWSTPGARAQGADSARVRLVEEWRFDGAANDLGVTPLAIVSSSGRIALPQPQDGYVLVIDSVGRTVARLGRRGAGPGEFRALTTAGWVGDTLWAFDPSLERLTLFELSGRVVRSMALTAVRAGPSIRTMVRGSSNQYLPLAVLPDGLLIALRMVRFDDGNTERTIVAITARGEISKVQASVSPDPANLVVSIPNFRLNTSIPFAASLAPAVSPDGRRLVLAIPGTSGRDTATLALTIINQTGDTVGARVVSFAALPIGRSARDSAIEVRLNPRGGALVVGQGVNPASVPPRPPAVTQRLREELNARVPFVHPAVRSVQVAANYWIWLERARSSSGSVYEVYDEGLNLAFGVRLPPKSDVVHMTATHIWTRELDDDDLPSIVRYRMSR